MDNKSIEIELRTLEKELRTAENASNQRMRSLMHKLQTARKSPSEMIIDQEKDNSKRYLSRLILEMEIAQIAESIVQVEKRVQDSQRKSLTVQ
jgi:hypothetical protein